MKKHVKLLGAIYLVWGAMGLLATLFIIILGLLGGAAAGMDNLKAGLVITTIFSVIMIIAAVVALPNVFAGWGLLRYRQWARILTIILSILNLFAFPIGTAVGVYGLWVLFDVRVVKMFEMGGYVAAPSNPQAG